MHPAGISSAKLWRPGRDRQLHQWSDHHRLVFASRSSIRWSYGNQAVWVFSQSVHESNNAREILW